MKVTLDLDQLLAQGSIDQSEYARLAALSRRNTGALAFNILVAFGVIAVGGATLALLPTTGTAIALGGAVFVAGMMLARLSSGSWRFLATVCVVIGALLCAGGIVWLGDGSVRSFLAAAALLAIAAALSRSALVSVLAVLALASCLGTRTGYLHAAYFLGVQEPALTIVAFTLFGAALHVGAKRLQRTYRRVAAAAVGAAVFLVNFGFWVGSLWGDQFTKPRGIGRTIPDSPSFVIADWVFALAWAAALIGAGIWAWRGGQRWMVNVVAVFAAIHFYTQWFERLGASAATVLAGGVIALAIALVLRTYNARSAATAPNRAPG